MRDQHPEDEAFWEWHTGECPHQPCPTCGWHIDFDPFDFKLCDACKPELERLIWRVLDPPHSELHDEYDSHFDRGSLSECVDRDQYGISA